MQRLLKFRMPIHVDGKFSHWHYWGFIDGEFVGPHALWVITPSEQFTGLQDSSKPPKDIFEGDIVRVLLETKNEHLAEVKFIGYGFSLSPNLTKIIDGKCLVAAKRGLVIGNTTEHHHLLKNS